MTAIVVLLIASGAVVQGIATKNYNKDLRNELYEDAASLGASIKRQLVEAIEISNAVSTFIALKPDIDAAEYSILAKGLRRDRPYLLNIAAAPDLVARFVYPVEPNRSVIGFDLKASKSQRDAAELARRVGRTVIAGPVELVQGGSGFIVRTPVTIDQGEGQTRFWGIVSVVISTAHLFDLAERAALPNAQVAIRGRNGLGPSGDVLYGPPGIFDKDPVLFDLELPYGQWQIAFTPVNGWNHLPLEEVAGIWAYTLLIAVVAIVLVLIALRYKSHRDRAERDLSAAIESIEDGFAMFDAEDRLMLSNSRYQSIYDLPDELIMRGTPFEDILKYGLSRGHYPEARGREEDWLRERLELHRNPNGSFHQLLNDGRWMKIAESKTANGMIVGFRVDITDLKNAQEAAERANEIKSKFLNNINHELRTPLTVILGYVTMLRDIRSMPRYRELAEIQTNGEDADASKNALESLSADIANIAERMQGAGRHLLDLINASLDLARIESGQMHVDLKPVRLAEIVRDLVKEFSQRIEQKQIEFSIGTVDFQILADNMRLRQILINLIDNAIKFTDSGKIEISANPRNGKLEIEVSDTGCGIPPAHLDHIFSDFYQGDSSTTRKHGGTGLGLAISRNLARLQGGSIHAESRVDSGTRFVVTIPLYQPQLLAS